MVGAAASSRGRELALRAEKAQLTKDMRPTGGGRKGFVFGSSWALPTGRASTCVRVWDGRLNSERVINELEMARVKMT